MKYLMFLSSDHGGGGIGRPERTQDFADILKMVFEYLRMYEFQIPFNGRIWTFSLWDIILTILVIEFAFWVADHAIFDITWHGGGD